MRPFLDRNVLSSRAIRPLWVFGHNGHYGVPRIMGFCRVGFKNGNSRVAMLSLPHRACNLRSYMPLAEGRAAPENYHLSCVQSSVV